MRLIAWKVYLCDSGCVISYPVVIQHSYNLQFLIFVVMCFCRTILVANNIQLLRKDSSPMFTGQDISKIRKFSRQKNVVRFIFVCFGVPCVALVLTLCLWTMCSIAVFCICSSCVACWHHLPVRGLLLNYCWSVFFVWENIHCASALLILS